MQTLKLMCAALLSFALIGCTGLPLRDSKDQTIDDLKRQLDQRDSEYGAVKSELNVCRQTQQMRQELRMEMQMQEQRDFRRWQESEGRRPHRPGKMSNPAPITKPAKPSPAVLRFEAI